jgi:hypothetical protein
LGCVDMKRRVHLGTVWMRVVGFALWPLFPPGKYDRYHSDRRLGGLHRRPGHDNGEYRVPCSFRMEPRCWKITVRYVLVCPDDLTCATCYQCINPPAGLSFDHCRNDIRVVGLTQLHPRVSFCTF